MDNDQCDTFTKLAHFYGYKFVHSSPEQSKGKAYINGMGILTCDDCVDSSVVSLPDGIPQERLLCMQLNMKSKRPLLVSDVHIRSAWTTEEKQQFLTTYYQWVAALDCDNVLVGDYNITPEDPLIQELLFSGRIQHLDDLAQWEVPTRVDSEGTDSGRHIDFGMLMGELQFSNRQTFVVKDTDHKLITYDFEGAERGKTYKPKARMSLCDQPVTEPMFLDAWAKVKDTFDKHMQNNEGRQAYGILCQTAEVLLQDKNKNDKNASCY